MSKRKGRRSRLPTIVVLLILVVLAVTMAGIFPFRQIIAQQRAEAVTRDKLTALQEENARLAERVDLLKTPAEIERIAREEFGYVRPGETAYVVVVPEDGPPATTPPAPVSLPPQRTWWDGVVDFFTGRDLDR